MSLPGGTLPGAPGSMWGSGGGTGTFPTGIPIRGLLYIAFREAHILKRPQGVNSENELLDGLIFLNQQINYWAARGCYAWVTTFQEFSLTPGYEPHLIGPDLTAPNFAAPMRPTSIESASIILPGAVPTDVPLRLRDSAWWAGVRVKTLQSNVPTDLYYEPDVPYGQIWLWPIPAAGYAIRLEMNVVLNQVSSLDDTFIAPPAYLAAVTLTLAEELCDLWEVPTPANLPRRALKARDALQSNNFLAPRIASSDYGTARGPSADFNYMTGGPSR